MSCQCSPTSPCRLNGKCKCHEEEKETEIHVEKPTSEVK